MEEAVNELESYQAGLLNLFTSLAAPDCYRQYHPDLSPLGWHLGHCIYTENYWIREVVMQKEAMDDELKNLYIPELSVKTGRGNALPGFGELISWTELAQAQNRQYLLDLSCRKSPHELLDNLFLSHFLSQHYAQHIETGTYVLNQRALKNGPVDHVAESLPARTPAPDVNTVAPGEYVIGSNVSARTYDNERPRFTCTLDAFNISKRPVTNGQYLEFMQEDGYRNPGFWDEQGWQWRERTNNTCPEHWRQDHDGTWYGINTQGSHPLKSDAVLSGINYFEANAFAQWAGARLPHEYEWETAKKQGLLQRAGECWEWCANEFHPYRGFHHHPYEGYSVPYFNKRHYALRGGSRYTQPCVKRDTFRNYYQPDKRHICAGLRLVIDE